MALIVCCAAVSASGQEKGAPRPGQAFEAFPGGLPEFELPVPPTAAPVAPEPTPPPPGTRDPFWPVGYVPPAEKKSDNPAPAEVETKVEPQWDAAIKTLIIKGIMKSGTGYVAVINEQVTGENDTISAVFESHTYSWRIVKINEKGVQFERRKLVQ
jgi:hypothetical protein